jgi:exopolysaccharide biosynthesis polyprenyl glycosylphosphotransferase
MSVGNRFKISLFLIGDVIALYAGLFITLVIRYKSGYYEQFEDAHALPFTILFVLWIIVFYIAGLYDLRRLRNSIAFLKTLFLALAVNVFLAIVLFYLVPLFGIAPKTNLLIFALIFVVIEVIWRRGVNRFMTFGEAPNRILMIGNGAIGTEIKNTIAANPQLGYVIKTEMEEAAANKAPEKIKEIALRERITLVLIPRQLKHEQKLVSVLYDLFGKGIVVSDLVSFYEVIMQKVPLADLEETWFLENIEGVAQFYDPLKNAGEVITALILFIVLSPIEALIAILVKLTSRGPVIYKQVRVGTHGKNFMLYKFRTMRMDAEKDGPQWSTGNDSRTTPIGNILRKSHLDELPQLVNILRGELSFVGPRPERPEFVSVLREKIPFYEIRLLIKPGVTGWAQINYHKDATTEDVIEKLQYDIFYLKNRAPILDLMIGLKTLKSFFVNPE